MQKRAGEVVAELAQQTGIDVKVQGAAAVERVSTEFTNLPLEEGIKRILQGKNYALTYAEEAPNRIVKAKIVAIRVFENLTATYRPPELTQRP